MNTTRRLLGPVAEPAPARTSLRELPVSHTSPADWDALFESVTTRLRLTVGERVLSSTDALVHEAACNIQSGVLECVRALELLRGMLVDIRVQGTSEVHNASHDELTALPNRHFFRERLDRALTPAQGQRMPPAVLYIDLDGFKPINDRHGHEVGDELLRIVALRLSRVMRSEDVVSRLGDDEFACLLADAVSRTQLSHVACKLFDAVSSPVKINGLQLTVRPSIGIAMSPGDGATTGALLQSADLAMLRAKREQSGYAFFDSCASS